MIDITMYTDNELSLIVDNDEYLYLLKYRSFKELLENLKENYIYTDIQLQVLIDDYNNKD